MYPFTSEQNLNFSTNVKNIENSFDDKDKIEYKTYEQLKFSDPVFDQQRMAWKADS